MAILSVSSEYGTGALEVGHAIEHLLGYEFISTTRILNEAKHSGRKWERLATKYTMESSDIWEGNDFVGFMALVQSIILGHAVKDNIIILSRGSNYLLKGIPHALRVRVVAPLEHRIKTIMEKERVNHETARLLVKQADREIDCTVHLGYGKDWDDPEAYEIKFDTEAQTPGEIMEIIRTLLKAKDTLMTPEAGEHLRRQYVTSKIKAAVLAHREVIIASLEVEQRQGGILLRGIVRSREVRSKIEEEVLDIADDIPLLFELGCQRIRPKRLQSDR